MNSLVGDYLASVNPNLAKKFKKESKASPLPPGSPNLVELVKEFQKNSPVKRKLSLSNGHTPAKKAKKVKYFLTRPSFAEPCSSNTVSFAKEQSFEKD